MPKNFNDEEFKKWLDAQPKKMIVVKTIIRSEQNKVLLVKPIYKETWMLPGGGVDGGESPEQAAIREVSEEIGIDIQVNSLELKGSIYKKEDDSLFLLYESTSRISESTHFRLSREEVTKLEFYDENEVAHFLPAYYGDFWLNYLS